MMLSKSAKKVFEAANDEYQNSKECDEEKAYVYFMKFVYVIQAIRKTSDFKEDKAYYNSMVSKMLNYPVLGGNFFPPLLEQRPKNYIHSFQFDKDVKRAIENSENLSCSLQKRYQDRLDEIKIEKDMKEYRLQPKTTITGDTEIKETATYPSNGSMKLTPEANNDKEGEINLKK